MDSASIKKYIVNNNKIETLLIELGAHAVREHNDYYSAAMPDGDNPSGIVLYKDNCGFTSYSRGLSGDVFDLIEYIKSTDFRGALNFVCQLFDLDNSYTPTPSDNNESILSVFTKHFNCNKAEEDFILSEAELEQLHDTEPISLLKEGVTPEAFNRFGCLYNYDRQRVVYVWHRWWDGKVVGTNSRTTNPSWQELGISKFIFSKGFNKSNNLYGLFKNYNDIKKKGEVVVFEAEKSVLKRASQFDYTAVALGGKVMTDEQVRILLSLNVDIILAFDQDIEVAHINEVANRLSKYRNVYIIDSSQLQAKDSPADLCDADYRKLYKNKKFFQNKA